MQRYRDDGFVVLKNFLRKDDTASLRYWAEEVEALDGEVVLQHYELCGDGTRRATRSEDFVPHHPQLRRLITTGRLPAALGQLLGEAVTLYKEKLNYKYPSGGGYVTHQDSPAYPETGHHLTALVAIDPATAESGALEFVRGHPSYRNREYLALTKDGVVDENVAAGLDYTLCEASPGDITVFDSFTPHRSGVNNSPNPRRVLYLTFNSAQAGDLRAEYYVNKRKQLKEGHISHIKHWHGHHTD